MFTKEVLQNTIIEIYGALATYEATKDTQSFMEIVAILSDVVDMPINSQPNLKGLILTLRRLATIYYIFQAAYAVGFLPDNYLNEISLQLDFIGVENL